MFQIYLDFTPPGLPLINALEIPSEVDLTGFARFLSAQGLPHRITEEGLNQVIWVADERAVAYVQAAYSEYQAGRLPLQEEEPALAPQVSVAQRVFEAFWRYPLSMGLILVCILFLPVGMNLQDVQTDSLFARMMFVMLVDVQGEQYFASMEYTLKQGEVWRLFSPMFVHFSWLHIVFNLLWLWEIGRRIEQVNGSWALLGIVMVSSLVANVLQYVMSSPGFFGGMSGVVFGLLGYALVWSKAIPSRAMGVPNGVYIFMLVYLAIGFTGAIDLLGLGSIANGAHLGGLLGGLATGGLAVLLFRLRHQNQVRPPQ